MEYKTIYTERYQSTQEVKKELIELKKQLIQCGASMRPVVINHDPITKTFRGKIEYNG